MGGHHINEILFVTTTRDYIVTAMYADTINESKNFKVLKIDTCANKSSIMGLPQYNAYCLSFDS